jgi:Domain of unknown function (DUF4956)
MTNYLLPAADLVAILVLTLGIYFPRHRRRDLVTSFVAVNVGVLGVSMALSSSSAGVGLGLGLFGVLSIIRLRSSELAQQEIAYYFVALALGLIGGLGSSERAEAITLMAVLVLAMAVADSTRLLSTYRQQVVLLDRAIADEPGLVLRLEELLGGRVHRVQVLRLDLVDDSTLVDVRWSREAGSDEAPGATVRSSTVRNEDSWTS